MNNILLLAFIGVVLIAGYHQAVNGQESTNGTEWWKSVNNTNPVIEATTIPDFGLVGCLITETETLVILDLNRVGCGDPIGSIEHFTSLGYQIKAIETLTGDRIQRLMYMQK